MNGADVYPEEIKMPDLTPKQPKMQVKLTPKCRYDDKEIKINMRRASKYPQVEYAQGHEALRYPPCAIVGGGPGLPSQLETLRHWPGDIFGINDTAGYLSDQGIPCYIYSIDSIDEPFKVGPLVKGAYFATRVHRKQFTQMKGKKIRVFHMAEDNKGIGVEGGPTAVCRAPHLLLRMGYASVHVFGCESCFYNVTHIGGNRSDAFWNLMIIDVGGKQFLTNGGFLLQVEWMVDYFKKYPKFIVNRSGGFMKAMLEDTEGWSLVAISEDLKKQYVSGGVTIFNREHTIEPEKLWQPPMVFEQSHIGENQGNTRYVNSEGVIT
jgi:hypothetical protein